MHLLFVTLTIRTWSQTQASSAKSSSNLAGLAPIILSTTSPLFKNKNVGIAAVDKVIRVINEPMNVGR